MSPHSDNEADHANALSSMKLTDDDKLDVLNRRTESVMTDMKTVLSNQDHLEEIIKVHLSVITGSPCSHAASNSDGGRASATDIAVTNDKQGIPTKKKNKKKKRKKKAKGDSNKGVAANWAAGNFVKILVGLFSLALLVSVALGIGQGGVWGPSHSLLRKRTDQSSRSSPPSSIVRESISYFYPSWEHGLYCHNDTSQRPSNYIEIGYTLFETAEDCCKHWTTNQGYFTNEGYNTCLLNSARTSPLQATGTGIPTTS
eukprot:CAMPEP_0172573950 /NCGR_PEP_ID=MMETSP1067-20121228/136457_1 /TAXON_ID=265564 ORGANISM="Thalassiosira punctigera, Strain Tpunct2005C2" /NCGR_SAMPLE_ID=MMETSP1067 /ASSEMBLY_ACC=CAM_ASM_000444 /LENGTH=256 /DNA_ID=CAMNT_0013366573 /DNA_START=1845 /DNA_END=2612 /DNA_ORIENTATION=-